MLQIPLIAAPARLGRIDKREREARKIQKWLYGEAQVEIFTGNFVVFMCATSRAFGVLLPVK